MRRAALPRASYPARLRKLPGIPRERFALCPLLLHRSEKQLLASLAAGPQFRNLQYERLLDRKVEGLRVVLLTESDYHARQTALHLATLSRMRRKYPARQDCWEDVDPDDDARFERERRWNSLAVIDASVLDPSLSPKLTLLSGGEPLRLAKLESYAALIWSPSGAALTGGVLEQIDDLVTSDPFERTSDIFIALRAGQVDAERLEELRFTHGFQLACVGQPDGDYLVRQLRDLAADLRMDIDESVDLAEVVERVREYRGEKFVETDLELLLFEAMKRGAAPPLTADDLTFRPLGEELSRLGLDGVSAKFLPSARHIGFC